MRMPELRSLPRDRRLRGYSRMRKTELVAFLTIWVKTIFSAVQGQTSEWGKACNKTCVISQFSGTWGRPPALLMGNKILPIATFYLF